ncbi:LOW QUALITY PROTEIN: hypothetical protein HID58_055934, partial [Brassica napus]
REMSIPEEEVGLLEDLVNDSVDHRGNLAVRSSTGGWRSASLIIGVEVAERFAYVGIACNMITYLTEQLGQSTANAAVNVNTWIGTASTLPIIGAFLADAYLGAWTTDLVGFPNSYGINRKPSFLMNVLFFCSLYFVAIAQGGHKPCVQAFGADQFDSDHPKERLARGSFFNWWFLFLSGGIAISILVMVYIQSNVNWAFGFGIPCLFMVMALAIFFLGRKTYRYPKRTHEKNNNGFVRIGRVFFGAIKNRKLMNLNKAMLLGEEGVEPCSNMDVEDAKGLVRLIPIWITSMVSMIPYAQYSTLFTKQGVTVDRRILPGLEIPPATLLSFVSISVLISVPIYEHVFLPIARKITKKPNGITMLQRIGTGMMLTCVNMVLAALVEAKRLRIAEEHGLIDKPNVTIPMSIWWFVPQYMLVGMIEVFGLVGAQEFFYDQVPTELRSIGLAFSLSALGLSNFLSGLLIIVVDWATERDGGHSWFNNNLNRAHIDYFYWLLAASTAIAFFVFVFISRSYVYHMSIPEEEVGLLEDLVNDSVDHRGNPAVRSSTGGWRSACLIIGVEVAERFAYVGIACNMITYLTEQLGLSTANAAVNVNTWSGTASTLPIIGAFGLGLLTLSASLTLMGSSEERKPSILMNVLFFCSLYLVAIAQGGHKPCVQAFGADQFDSDHPKERIARGSFFNWWFLFLSGGIAVSILVMVYIQSNVNWAFGFGIPCLFMVMALAIFFLGRKTYRYPKRSHEKNNNGFVRIGRVFIVAFKNRKLISLKHSGQLEFLAKAMLLGEEGVEPCSNMDVEDAKGLIMLIPIWITSMLSMVPYAQYSTLFTKQGVTVDRRILPGFVIPPASFLSLVSISVLISVPIYEHYMLVGMIEVFGLVGAQEFFYDQVPTELRSIGLAFSLSALGLSNFLSGLLIIVIDWATESDGGHSWFNNNLNRAHIDYFYWLLAACTAIAFFAFVFISRSYVYRRVD